MFFDARVYSEQYVRITPGRLENNDSNPSEESEKRILKKFKKDKKIIYAFFLDIA